MAAFKDHFPVMLDYNKFKYYRVNSNDVDEFEKLQGIITQKVNQKKVINPDIINRYFFLLQDVQTIENKHYIPYIENFANEIDKYFAGNSKYYFEREPRYWHKKHQWVEKPIKLSKEIEVMYSYGFKDMIEWVISSLLRSDKKAKASFTKEHCFYQIILTILKFKNHLNALSKEGEEKLSEYRISVIAAYMAHKVFGFPLSLYAIENDEGYYQAGKYYMSKVKKNNPSFFKKTTEKVLFSIRADLSGK